ncbi:MAG: xanthine dehydrogenase family protein molybdopterin-binding subunit [Planctomycetes bacterium]|nr:xanthine dehydrogenase family protein molybdopterin-binding subunit [Planctomycetota bacterium]
MSDMPEFNHIGKPLPLIDSRGKVTGEGIYTDDIKLPNMLVARILRSPHAHAKIVKLDTSKAEALPGVRAVVTGNDAVNTFGVLPISKDELAFARDKVRFPGDQVAAVAAETIEIADKAIRLIEVEYELLDEFQTFAQALKDTGVKIHDYTRHANNIHKHVEQNFGDVDEDLKNAEFIAEGSFKMPGCNHAFTEPHAVVAHYDTEGNLTMWSATQVPHYLQRSLAEVMEMDMHRIRVIKPLVGGGFGGKSDPFSHEMAVALLSRKCRRPVKLLFDREDVFLLSHGRHPSEIWLKVGLDENRKFTGMDLTAKIDGGAFGSFGVVSTYYNGVLSQGPYRFNSFRYDGKRLYTNKPMSGAMRGHGSVNTRFAIEVLVDELAEQAGVDPIDLRLDNCLSPNSRTLNEFRITSCGIRECLERVREASGWDEKRGNLPKGRGIGIGCGFYISGSAARIHWNRFPQSTVHIKIDMDGGVTIHSGAAEIGQGSDTMLAQIVAEVLGIPISRCRVKAQDSHTAPFDLGSYSSRVTFMAGIAAKAAAEEIAEKLRAAAEKITGHPGEGFRFHDDKLTHRTAVGVEVSFEGALHEAMADYGALIGRGHYGDAPQMGGTGKGKNAGLSPSYSYQAFVCELEVDDETGFIRPIHVWAAHDVGRALNPLAVEGQIEGSVHMGLGQALTEQLVYQKGMLLNGNLTDYRVVDSITMPEVDVIIVESQDPEGPFGAKECGEGALAPIIPAVANAVYDAVGVRVRELPMTPDKILELLEKRERRQTKTLAAAK